MWKFIQNFFKKPIQTGAIAPSSKALAKAMVKHINFSTAKHIVELGPGTGVFTRELLQNMKKDSTLTCVELNDEFIARLKKIPDKRIKVVKGDATQLSSIVSNANYIVSGLPVANFGEKRTQLYEEIKKTAPVYIQFHYTTFIEKHLKEHFVITHKELVLNNLPPATVYTMRTDVLR